MVGRGCGGVGTAEKMSHRCIQYGMGPNETSAEAYVFTLGVIEGGGWRWSLWPDRGRPARFSATEGQKSRRTPAEVPARLRQNARFSKPLPQDLLFPVSPGSF